MKGFKLIATFKVEQGRDRIEDLFPNHNTRYVIETEMLYVYERIAVYKHCKECGKDERFTFEGKSEHGYYMLKCPGCSNIIAARPEEIKQKVEPETAFCRSCGESCESWEMKAGLCPRCEPALKKSNEELDNLGVSATVGYGGLEDDSRY